MAELLNFNNSTIVTGTTSTGGFLVMDIEKAHVGFPMYDFEITEPQIDIALMAKDIISLKNPSIVSSASSYGVGLAVVVQNSAFAIPMMKIDSYPNMYTGLNVNFPTLVTNLSSTGTFMTFEYDKKGYGIPLYKYDTYYPSQTAVSALSTEDIKTIFVQDKLFGDIKGAGSTQLNPKIRTYESLIERTKRELGWPSININICDANIAAYIDKAIEYYTKYAGYTEEFLIFNTESCYKKGYGVKLDTLFNTPQHAKNPVNGEEQLYDYDLGTYRKVIACHSFEQGEAMGVNTLFTLEQAMVQQTYFGYMLGSAGGFDIQTFEVLKGWLDTRKKVLGQMVYWRFDPRTQVLRLTPEPYEYQNYWGVIGCYVERPIRDLIMEPWVMEYVLALTKIALGRIYGRFTGVTIPLGGGQVAYSEVLSEGTLRKKELEEELYKGYGFVESPPSVFILS